MFLISNKTIAKRVAQKILDDKEKIITTTKGDASGVTLGFNTTL